MNVFNIADLWYFVLAVVMAALVGYPVADRLMTPRYSLKEHLFEKDNPAAGLTFGAVLLAMFYVVHGAMTGETDLTFWGDMGAAAIAVVLSLVIMVVTYRSVDRLVGLKSPDGHNLNHEIFEQRNFAAAAVAVVLVMSIANGITEEDALGPEPFVDFGIALMVMVLGIGSILLYRLTHLGGKSFAKEFFQDDNPAAGISLIGFGFAVNVILHKMAFVAKIEGLPVEETFLVIAGFGLAFVLLLAVARQAFLVFVGVSIGIPIVKELYEENNHAAGYIDAAFSIGLAVVLVGAFV